MNNKKTNFKNVVKGLVFEALTKSEIEFDPKKVEVNRTADLKFGDFATNIALKLAKETNHSSIETANKLTDSLKIYDQISKVEVAGPGFVNITLSDEVWQNVVKDVLEKGEKFGSNDLGEAKKARVEFVSANPTGPLHFGNARGGPIGDALARVLEFSGYQVLREYIHNDIGGQVIKLGQTIVNVSKGEKLEDQEYKGEYIKEIVEKIGEFSDAADAGKKACDMMLDEILADCEEMGIKFDEVFPESGFVESGKTKDALDQLQKDGVIKKKGKLITK